MQRFKEALLPPRVQASPGKNGGGTPDPVSGPAGPTGPPAQADLGPRVLAALGYTVFLLVLIDHLGQGPMHALDAQIMDLVPHDPSIAIVAASGWITHVGDWQVLTGLSLLGTVILLRRGRLLDAGLLPFSFVGGVVAVRGLKLLIGRERPELATSVSHAFPSGHATEAALVLMMMAVLLFGRYQRVRPWAEGVAVGMALVIAFTRVVLNEHWATDVVAGLGLGWGLAGSFLLLRAYLQRRIGLGWAAPAEASTSHRAGQRAPMEARTRTLEAASSKGEEALLDVAIAERVRDGVRLRVTQRVNVDDEPCIPIALEDVA